MFTDSFSELTLRYVFICIPILMKSLITFSIQVLHNISLMHMQCKNKVVFSLILFTINIAFFMLYYSIHFWTLVHARNCFYHKCNYTYSKRYNHYISVIKAQGEKMSVHRNSEDDYGIKLSKSLTFCISRCFSIINSNFNIYTQAQT